MKETLNFDLAESPVELIEKFPGTGNSLFIKREDLLHPEVSGNKFRKLKYNLKAAKEKGENQLLTFGGAYSNHIAAVAAAGKIGGFKTVGVIRGEELAADLENTLKLNSTLQFAASCGMHLHFVTREEYRNKDQVEFLEDLRRQYGSFYLLPEGGTNPLAVKGCEEILSANDKDYDFVCCPVGTGGTVSGIINSSGIQQVLGFSSLKGDFLEGEVKIHTRKTNWTMIKDYHFGGYGKISEELILFINNFRSKYHISLDPVYTGKMFFGIFDLIDKSFFPANSRILAVHTGGLQGIEGMNKLLLKKKLPQIDV